MSPILLPMMIAGIGIIFSIIATLFVRISETASISTVPVQKALNMGNWGLYYYDSHRFYWSGLFHIARNYGTARNRIYQMGRIKSLPSA
jgi:hypothetical protein